MKAGQIWHLNLWNTVSSKRVWENWSKKVGHSDLSPALLPWHRSKPSPERHLPCTQGKGMSLSLKTRWCKRAKQALLSFLQFLALNSLSDPSYFSMTAHSSSNLAKILRPDRFFWSTSPYQGFRIKDYILNKSVCFFSANLSLSICFSDPARA